MQGRTGHPALKRGTMNSEILLIHWSSETQSKESEAKKKDKTHTEKQLWDGFGYERNGEVVGRVQSQSRSQSWHITKTTDESSRDSINNSVKEVSENRK